MSDEREPYDVRDMPGGKAQVVEPETVEVPPRPEPSEYADLPILNLEVRSAVLEAAGLPETVTLGSAAKWYRRARDLGVTSPSELEAWQKGYQALVTELARAQQVDPGAIDYFIQALADH